VSAWRQLPKLNVEGSIPFARSTWMALSRRVTAVTQSGSIGRAAKVP
jgi:hypothetical protein